MLGSVMGYAANVLKNSMVTRNGIKKARKKEDLRAELK